jgi:hypothetical protein
VTNVYILWLLSPAAAQPPADAAIQAHLEATEARLREVDTTGWPAEQVAARLRTLDALSEYAEAGVYPHNLEALVADPRPVRLDGMYAEGPDESPIFVDEHGHACAVAWLMLDAGFEDTVAAVHDTANDAWVHQLDPMDLAPWLEVAGLTLEEAAMIQPTYGPTTYLPPYSGTCGPLDPLVDHAEHGTLSIEYRDCIADALLTEADPEKLAKYVAAAMAQHWQGQSPTWGDWIPRVEHRLDPPTAEYFWAEMSYQRFMRNDTPEYKVARLRRMQLLMTDLLKTPDQRQREIDLLFKYRSGLIKAVHGEQAHTASLCEWMRWLEGYGYEETLAWFLDDLTCTTVETTLTLD